MVNRCETKFAAGRTKVGARFIVHSSTGIGGQRLAVGNTQRQEGAAEPRPTPRPPCGGQETNRLCRDAVPTLPKEKGGPEAALVRRWKTTQRDSTKSVRSFCWVLFCLR
jgi:hypothetical protein